MRNLENSTCEKRKMRHEREVERKKKGEGKKRERKSIHRREGGSV